MKKNIFDVVSQGMSEYFDEEAELKAEAEARIKAEIEAAWNQHDSNIKEEIKKDFDSALQEQADIVRANKEINEHLENMRSFDEELMHIKYMFRDRTYGASVAGLQLRRKGILSRLQLLRVVHMRRVQNMTTTLAAATSCGV